MKPLRRKRTPITSIAKRKMPPRAFFFLFGGLASPSAKRHPSIGNRVVVYANATILGGDTTVGDESVIGGNVWLTHSVPPKTTVYYEGK